MPISLWDKSAAETAKAQPLAGDCACDLAIVGGGFTGLSTALHGAQAGLECHVIEAGEIGQGGSGRNVGLVNAGVWLPPDDLTAALGETYGPRYTQRFGAAPEYVFRLIEKHQMQCEATRCGTLHAAHSRAGQREIERRYRQWQRLGAPVELLTAAQMTARVGSQAFQGGLLDHRAGTINPMGYCRGLARAALAAGARISTGTRAMAIRRDGGWCVETEQGTLRARYVVLGTNAYTDALWPGLQDSLAHIDFFQLATAPLGPEAAHILPEGQGVWTTGNIMRALRRDAEGRLIFGSMGALRGDIQGGLTARWARKQLKRIFPDLGDVAFAEGWDGKIAMTADHLPRIHQLDEGVYAPIGYNGRGITTGTIFGQAIAGLLTGTAPEDLPLPLSTPQKLRAGRLRSLAYRTAFTANHLLRSF